MDNEHSLLEQVARFVDSVRGVFGFAILLFFAIVFLVKGNTAGQLVGLLLLLGCLAIAISVVRQRTRSR